MLQFLNDVCLGAGFRFEDPFIVFSVAKSGNRI